MAASLSEIMSDQEFVVRPEQTREECMALMTQQHIRHLPIMAGQQLIDVISIGDVVKAIIADQMLEMQQLENYILGRDYVTD